MTDAERDRYLQEALRHAPDADAAPPPALSAAILREAQAAVAPVRPSWRDRIAAFWQALASPRLAGALASVMVLTLAGVMWWGRPIEQAMPVREAPVAAAPVAAPAAAPPLAIESPAAVAAPTAAATVAPPPETAIQPATDKPPPAAKAELRRTAPADAPARLAKERQPSITAAAPPPAPDNALGRSEASRDAAGAAAPAMPAAPVPATPPPPPPMSVAPPAPAEMAAVPKPSARRAPSVAALSDAASAPPGLSLAAGATGWDTGDGRARVVDAEFAAFLARLEAAAGGGLGLAAKLAPLAERNEARSATSATLNLQRDGQPLRSLRLTGDLLTIETPDGATRRVPLAPGSGAALAARLAELSR